MIEMEGGMRHTKGLRGEEWGGEAKAERGRSEGHKKKDWRRCIFCTGRCVALIRQTTRRMCTIPPPTAKRFSATSPHLHTLASPVHCISPLRSPRIAAPPAPQTMARTPSFLAPSLPHARARPVASPPRCGLAGAGASRRCFLLALALTPVAVAPALADRTGKFSTKLTAKRRYLPRISRGVAALGALVATLGSGGGSWSPDALSFVENDAADLQTAMQLFATMYFSEGNRIGATERVLGELVDELGDNVRGIAAAARKEDRGAAVRCADRAADAANRYLDTAKVEGDVEPVPRP